MVTFPQESRNSDAWVCTGEIESLWAYLVQQTYILARYLENILESLLQKEMRKVDRMGHDEMVQEKPQK